MSLSITHGYHIALEIDSVRIQRILDDFIPASIPIPIIPGITAVVTPLTPPIPSGVTIGAGNTLTIQAFRKVRMLGRVANVNITLVVNVNIDAMGNTHLTIPTVPVITARDMPDTDSIAWWASLAHMSPAMLLETAGVQLQAALTAFSLPPIPLPITIPIGSGVCNLVLDRVDVHTIPGSLFILIHFTGAGLPAVPFDASGFTTSLRGTAGSALVIANETFLALGSCLATQEPVSPLFGTAFTTSGNCSALSSGHHTISLDGIEFTINTASICVVGNQVVLSGNAQLHIPGFTLHGDFTAPIGFECHTDGTIFPVFDASNVNINLSLEVELWVYLAGIALALVGGFVLGPIVAIVIGVLLGIIVGFGNLLLGIIGRFILPAIGSSFLHDVVASGYRMIPAQILRIIGDLQCQEVLLDDFVIKGFLNNPTPSLADLSMLYNTRLGEVQTSTGGSGLGSYIEYSAAHRVAYTLSYSNFVGMVRVAWYLNGVNVNGNGMQIIDGKRVYYTIDARTITINTGLGDNLNTILAARLVDADGYAKQVGVLLNVEGVRRDYPEQDALQGALMHLGQIIPIQGINRPIPMPDPAPEEARVDLIQNLSEAVLGDITLKEITSSAQFRQRVAELDAIG